MMGWVLIGRLATRRRGIMALVTVGTVVSWLSLMACDTPVYRYAMYRWEPAPYEVFFFHSGPIAEDQARVNGLIQSAQTATDKPANVELVAVDVSRDAELKTVPRSVRDAWQAQEGASTPTYWAYTPTGQQIFAGNLDEAALRTMLDSPARQEIIKQLAEGKAGVLVLATGPDEKANAEAEKLLRDVIQEIAAGKIPLYSPPAGLEGPEPKPEAAPKLAVGWVRVARDDPRERWLVEALLSTEEDLKTDRFAKANMVFPVFGRGRALPPCVDKGITRDNLIACVEFVTGACSCTVKDQNPGVDLLIAHDWVATAEKLAERYGAEEGNESQVGAAALFPQLMIPAGAGKEPAGGSQDPAAAPGGKPGSGASAQSTTPGKRPTTSGEGVQQEGDRPASAPAPQAEPKASEEDSTAPEREAETESETPAREVAAPSAGDEFSSVFLVGGCVAAALVFLFGLTFFILRPR